MLLASQRNIIAQENDILEVADTDFLQSIYALSTDTLSGTSFLFDRDNKQYLITARHLFSKRTKTKDIVFYKLNNRSINEPFNGVIYFHPNENVDIAVIQLTKPIFNTKIKVSENKSFLGKDVYFFGFPLQSLGTNFEGFKLPLIKKAIFSGVLDLNNNNLLLLDGYNIEGFSGGPIMSKDPKTNKFYLLGVISGYFNNVKNQNSGIIVCNFSGKINDIINEIDK